MARSRFAVLALCGFVSLLAACSSGPNQDDIRAAYIKQIDQAKANAEKMAGAGAATGLFGDQFAQARSLADSIKLIGCKSDGDHAYACDIEIQGNGRAIRMAKGDDGWVMILDGK